MTNSPSVINSYVEAIVNYIEKQGISDKLLFSGLSINRIDLAITGNRVDIITMQQLWLNAVALTKDDCLGLHIGQQIRLGAYNILGSLLLNSRDINTALEQLIRYQSLISEGGVFSLVKENSTLFIDYKSKIDNKLTAKYQIECVISGLIKFLFDFAPFEIEARLRPIKITFCHAGPLDAEVYQEFFLCPVIFSSKSNGLLFDSEVLNFPIPHADQELFLHHQQLAERKRLLNQHLPSWHDQVVSIISQQDNWFNITPELVADHLNISLRRMQRLLFQEHTSYQKLSDNLRKEQALSLLKQGVTSRQVAETLGYNDLTSFHRAFKRWYNKSPKMLL